MSFSKNRGAIVKVKCPCCDDEVIGLTPEGVCRQCLEQGKRMRNFMIY